MSAKELISEHKRPKGTKGARAKERLLNKVLRFEGMVSEDYLVLIRWLYKGRHLQETVSLPKARHRRSELESQGAVVYWSERLLMS